MDAQTVTELEIVNKKWHNRTKPTLVISVDSLVSLLNNESAVINEDDISRLLGSIHTYAAMLNTSAQSPLDSWEESVVKHENNEA